MQLFSIMLFAAVGGKPALCDQAVPASNQHHHSTQSAPLSPASQEARSDALASSALQVWCHLAVPAKVWVNTVQPGGVALAELVL